MHKEREYFAEWLDRTLNEKGIAAGEVARALGVSNGTVSKWRSGKNAIAFDSARKLAAFLDVQPVRLAVTAGLMTSEEAGAPPLPMPEEDTSNVRRAKEHIMRIPGLSHADREALLRTLEERYLA